MAGSTIEEKERLGYAPPDNPLLRRGDLRDSISREVRQREADIGSTSPVMVFHEYGTSKMPARSVLAGAVIRKEPEIVQSLGKDLIAFLDHHRLI